MHDTSHVEKTAVHRSDAAGETVLMHKKASDGSGAVEVCASALQPSHPQTDGLPAIYHGVAHLLPPVSDRRSQSM